MKRVVKVAFPYAADGQNTRMTEVGAEIDFPDSIVPGLEEAGLVERAAAIKTQLAVVAAPVVAAPVVAPVEPPAPDAKLFEEPEKKPADPVAIPNDWKSMKWGALRVLAEKIKGTAVDNPKAALAVIEAELAQRASAK